ncbi:hypothetical protein C8J56DRAFT_1070771 [Mycena floridula]|nr:hypothetical protein C8J56DRAFT_1070771 [Mycena floridula]
MAYPPTPTSNGKAKTRMASSVISVKDDSMQVKPFPNNYNTMVSRHTAVDSVGGSKELKWIPRLKFHNELPVRISYSSGPSSFVAVVFEETRPDPNEWLMLMEELCVLGRNAHAKGVRLVKYITLVKITNTMDSVLKQGIIQAIISLWDTPRIEQFRQNMEVTRRLCLGGMIVFDPEAALVEKTLWDISELVEEAVRDIHNEQATVESMLMNNDGFDYKPKSKILMLDCVMIQNKPQKHQRPMTSGKTNPQPKDNHETHERDNTLSQSTDSGASIGATSNPLSYRAPLAVALSSKATHVDLKAQLSNCFGLMHHFIAEKTFHWDQKILETLNPSVIDEEALKAAVRRYVDSFRGPSGKNNIIDLVGKLVNECETLAMEDNADKRIHHLIAIIRAALRGSSGLMIWKT